MRDCTEHKRHPEPARETRSSHLNFADAVLGKHILSSSKKDSVSDVSNLAWEHAQEHQSGKKPILIIQHDTLKGYL